jgi:hypothetical protein
MDAVILGQNGGDVLFPAFICVLRPAAACGPMRSSGCGSGFLCRPLVAFEFNILFAFPLGCCPFN